ncbi:hypothetical protein [Lysobacter sp. HA35]
MKRTFTLLLAAGLFASSAFATTPPTAPLQIDAIVTQQAQIREEVLSGTGRYKEMPQATRDELLAKQGALLKLLDGKHDTGELTNAQRLEAFNTLEWIEATINKEPDERMICQRTRATGSLRTTTVCKTKRQIKEAQDRARKQMDGSMPIDI